MIHHKWLEVLRTINSDNDLNKANIIEKIKEKLKAIDPTTYEKWKKFNFAVDYRINNCAERDTLLHIAAGNGYIKAVKALLEIGASMRVVNQYKVTPLHLAAEGGHTEVVKILTDAGAGVNAIDEDKITPLHLAAEGGYTEVVKILIDAGAKANAVDRDGVAPLHLAAKGGYTNTINALLEEGGEETEINVMDKKGLTPLSFAARNGHKEAVYVLMKKGADFSLGNKNRTLRYLTELKKSDNLKQLRKEQRDDRYELLKYSLLRRDDRSLVDIVREDTFDDLTCTWFADISDLTSSQKDLNKELLSILQACPSCNDKGDYDENGYIARLEKFLEKNQNNQDLRAILNLKRGESKLTVLHIVSSVAGVEEEYDKSVALLLKAGANPNAKDDRGKTPLHYATGPESMASLLGKGANPNEQDNEGKTPLHCIASTDYSSLIPSLLKSGARPDICDEQGKTPLDIAIDDCNYYAEGYLLTEEQKRLQRELDYILGNVDKDNLHSLGKFLNEYEDTQNLKRVLNLRNNEGKSQIFQHIRNIFHSDETSYKEAERLLLVAGAKDFKGKERSFKFRTLWDNLILSQQKNLSAFLKEVSKAQDMYKLAEVVDTAMNYGVRFNFPHQGRLYGEVHETKYSFMDYVMKRIKEISELKKNPKVASDIVCKLVSRGAVLYVVNSIDVLDTLELEFKDHKTDMIKAHEEYINNILEFMEIVKSAATGRVRSAKLDNSTFYLECSENSTIDVAKITDGASDLGLTQGKIRYGREIVKIGKSEVEIIITANGMRRYTNLADNSSIVLTFYTSLGELEVDLYPDAQNKNLIRVEVRDQEMLKQLKDCEEEIGKNCSLGKYSVHDAIEQGYFERWEKLMCSETVSLSKEVSEKVKAAVEGLKPGDIGNFDNTSLPFHTQESIQSIRTREV